MYVRDQLKIVYSLIFLGSFNYLIYSQTLSISPILGITKGFSYYQKTNQSYFKIKGDPITDCGINHGVVIEYIYKDGFSLTSGLNTSSSQVSLKVNYPPHGNVFSEQDNFVTKQDYITIPLLVGINRKKTTIIKRKKEIDVFKHKFSAGVSFAFSNYGFQSQLVKNTDYDSPTDSIGFLITGKKHSKNNISIQFRYETLIRIKYFSCYVSLILNKGLINQMGGDIVLFVHDKIFVSGYSAYGDFINLSLRYPFYLKRRDGTSANVN